MNASTVIKRYTKGRTKYTPAFISHTLLLCLTDHLYTKAGYEEQIPATDDYTLDDKYHSVYCLIEAATCIGSAQLDNFNFDSWEVLHNDGDDNTGPFFVINLYRGKTSYKEFCEKRGERLNPYATRGKYIGDPDNDYLPFVFDVKHRFRHAQDTQIKV